MKRSTCCAISTAVGHVRFRHGDVVRHELVAPDRRGLRRRQGEFRFGGAVRLGAMTVRVDFVETSKRWRGALPGADAG